MSHLARSSNCVLKGDIEPMNEDEGIFIRRRLHLISYVSIEH